MAKVIYGVHAIKVTVFFSSPRLSLHSFISMAFESVFVYVHCHKMKESCLIVKLGVIFRQSLHNFKASVQRQHSFCLSDSQKILPFVCVQFINYNFSYNLSNWGKTKILFLISFAFRGTNEGTAKLKHIIPIACVLHVLTNRFSEFMSMPALSLHHSFFFFFFILHRLRFDFLLTLT